MSEERLRWEGEMQARMADAERRLDAINGSIQAHAAASNNLAVTVGGLTSEVKTRAAVWSTLGSLFGGGVVSVLVIFLTR